jgi:hypothetical protein
MERYKNMGELINGITSNCEFLNNISKFTIITQYKVLIPFMNMYFASLPQQPNIQEF